MLWEMFNAARDLGRIQEIAAVLIRYGFGGFVQELGFRRFLEKAGKVLHWQSAEEHKVLDTPQRMRHALEDFFLRFFGGNDPGTGISRRGWAVSATTDAIARCFH